MTPYNTGKVLIGSRYEVPPPPMPTIDGDAALIQRALLGKRRLARPSETPVWLALVCAAAAVALVYLVK